MSEPERNDETDSAKIVVDWSAISDPENGNSIVISYSLEYDSGTNQNQWTAVTGLTTDLTDLTYVVTDGILRGGTYHFRLRAKNQYGWGVYSDTVIILAATRPLAADDIMSSV
jgi:hypothetical protein